MKEVIIIETTRPQKLKSFLNQEHFAYKVYQESKRPTPSEAWYLCQLWRSN